MAGVACALAALSAMASPAQATTTLQRFHISADYVSGISSGAAAAVQFQVAHSATFHGVAFFSGPPYDCAQGSLVLAIDACANPFLPDQLSQLEANTDQWSRQGLIDSTSHLAGVPVYEWHGIFDTVVAASVADDTATFFQHYGSNVNYVNYEPSGHGWISPLGPDPCAVTLTPYVNNCGIDADGAFLTQWLGSVHAPNYGTPAGRLISFDQNPFAPQGNAAAVDLAGTGYEYVPNSCASGATCRLVLALHGCTQNATSVGTAFVQDTGLNQYADTNHLVVLYPQVVSGDPANTGDCWDWWGYLPNDADYAQKTGRQMASVMAMVAASGG